MCFLLVQFAVGVVVGVGGVVGVVGVVVVVVVGGGVEHELYADYMNASSCFQKRILQKLQV